MKTTSPVLHGALLAAGLLAASSANAGTVIFSSTAPTTNLLASSTTSNGEVNGTRDYTDNGDPLGTGQSFTVASESTFSAFTLLGAALSGANNASPVPFNFSFGTVTDGVFTSTLTDSGSISLSEVEGNAAVGDYMIFQLATPPILLPGVTYAAYLSTDPAYIGTAVSLSDVYAGGGALTGGTAQAYDRVFFVQGTAVPEPSSLLLGITCGMGMLGLRRRRG
ncbi:MAG TPA: PEP-CTERM sorting domain-containing protein [Chthoniobacteraceae bacterium]|jgi:hypothetical protein